MYSKSRMFWNVRAMPSVATWWGLAPVISRSWKITRPVVGGKIPVIPVQRDHRDLPTDHRPGDLPGPRDHRGQAPPGGDAGHRPYVPEHPALRVHVGAGQRSSRPTLPDAGLALGL